MQNKSDFFVIGLGNWGTALANHLARIGHRVTAYTRSKEICDGINQDRHNPVYQSGFKLSENLCATQDLEKIDQKYVMLAIPAVAITEALGQLKLGESQVLISATKGLDPISYKTALQLAGDLPGIKAQLAVLSGPGFAADVLAGLPAVITIAARDQALAEQTAHLFSGENLKFYYSTDVVGVETGGIVKNIIAIVAGIGDSMQLGESGRAGMITRGLSEMNRFAVALGADSQTLYGLSGLGDLVLTATSKQSRNYQIGWHLGQGMSLSESITAVKSTAEGVLAAKTVAKLAADHDVEMPITAGLNLLLEDQITAAQLLESLMSRSLKSEF